MKSLAPLALLSFVTTASTVYAETDPARVILIHGAFTTPDSWDPVAQLLEAEGLDVTLADLPLTSLDEDVAAAQKAMETGEGPLVLVGHSWGGVVMGEAAASTSTETEVKALVYVAAYAPDRGESLGALAAAGPATEGVLALRPNEAGGLYVDQTLFEQVFAEDLPKELAAELAANQRPLAASALETPALHAAWHNIPSHFVIATNDKVNAAETQKFFAERMGATVTEIESSHVPQLSHPEQVAAVILNAVAGR